MNSYKWVPLLAVGLILALMGCGNLEDKSPGSVAVTVEGLRKAGAKDVGTTPIINIPGLGTFAPSVRSTGALSSCFLSNSVYSSSLYVTGADFGQKDISSSSTTSQVGASNPSGTCVTGSTLDQTCWFDFLAGGIPSGSGRVVHWDWLDASNVVTCAGATAPVTVLPNAVADAGTLQWTAVAAACGAATNSGGAGVTTTVHDVGKKQGTFTFAWDAYSIPDQFQVSYEGKIILDTGSVSGAGSRNLSINGSSTTITVTVTGSTSGTSWTYTVGCAQ
jgi:hypothetical protein